MSGAVQLTVADLAYTAALIDTRGKITPRTVGDAVLPQVSISGKPFPALQWLGEITEVRVVPTERSYAKAGCAEHCSEKHQHIRSMSGRWSVCGAKATIVLAAVQPYLRFCAAEVEDAIRLGLRADWKGATPLRMASLGWPLPLGMCGAVAGPGLEADRG